QMGSNIYNPNSKILTVGIPELQINDMVHYVAKRNVVKPRVPNTWSDYQVFEYTDPICRYSYEVHAPKSLPLSKIILKDEIEGSVAFSKREEGDRIIYRWLVTDVPRMYREPGMPSLHTVVQRLLVSTIPSWRDISRWYWKLCEPHFEATPAMEAKVKELSTELTNREARINAIFTFVSQQIRYMGITTEKEAPGYEPHDAADTFEKRHGVCRDKAALLVSMLRLAGFKAYPVIIHNGPKKDMEVPQPYFNHAIVAVAKPGGGYMLMDPTDENTKDMFPAYLCNQSYLVATPEGETLLTSAIIPASENTMWVKTQARIAADGRLTGTAELSFDGINDNAYRGYFSRIKPVERRRFFEGVVSRALSGARLTQITITPEKMLDTTQPLHVSLGFEAPNAIVSDGATVMLPVPRLGTGVGMVNFILRQTGLKKRKYPLNTHYACGVREELTLEIAPELGRIVAMPEYPPIDTDTILWKRTLEASGTTLSGTSQFQLKGVEFNPAQYLALKGTLKSLELNARKKIILATETDSRARRDKKEAAPDAEEQATPTADTIVEDDLWEFDVTAPGSWTLIRTVAQRILTYKGKKDNAELKWDYNPAWGDVKLLEATVTNGTDVKIISEDEINLMDASWVANAPRYPAAKTLVASLPGVEVDSVIRYKVKHTFRDRPFFATRVSFNGHDPVKRRAIHLSIPESLPLRTHLFGQGVLGQFGVKNAVVSRRREDRGRVLLEWTAQDMPAVKRENHLPPWWAFNPALFASTGNWRDYAKRVRKILLAAADSKAAPEKVHSLTADTPGKTVIAIRDFVTKNIRLAGPGLNALPLSAITPADQTLAEGYGNSADRAVVLYALLKAADFRPEFILASNSPRIDDLTEGAFAFPAAHLFPTVLVQVKVDGDKILLNDTSEYAALGTTAHDERMALALRKGKLFRIQPPKDKRNRREIHCQVVLEANGTARIAKTTHYYGTAFAARKKYFAELPPEERRRYQQEAVARISQAAEASEPLVTEFDSYPGVETVVARVPDYAVVDGDFLYFDLPVQPFGQLGLRAATRTNAFYRGSPLDLKTETQILLPEPFLTPVLLPTKMNWKGPNGLGRLKVRIRRFRTPEGRQAIAITHHWRIRPAVVPARKYDRIQEPREVLFQPGAKTVLLRK
ncbi:MAG: DUF3857 domain-containing protein, partial [Lentisphaeria bacterium]|nr:DUF3857 domain-containing protein [Lentisphaeria bacterium]